MTIQEKVDMVKTIMGEDAPNDTTIITYLVIAKTEILQWRYSYCAADMPDDVPDDYEMTQIFAVVDGFTQRGLEGQTVSIENGIHRHFIHADIVQYIHNNVIPMAKVPGRVVSE